MNAGVISSRYAKALLKYTQETGNGERVFTQVRDLLRRHADMASVELEPELRNLVALLIRKDRLEEVKSIFRDYVRMYCDSTGTVLAHLTSVVPSPDLERKVTALLEEKTGRRIILEADTDPGLIGGFTLLVGDYLLDASVRHQIDAIRRQFIIQNNRIV